MRGRTAGFTFYLLLTPRTLSAIGLHFPWFIVLVLLTSAMHSQACRGLRTIHSFTPPMYMEGLIHAKNFLGMASMT